MMLQTQDVAGRHCEVLPVPNRVKKKSSISYLNAGRVPPIFVYAEYVLLPTTLCQYNISPKPSPSFAAIRLFISSHDEIADFCSMYKKTGRRYGKRVYIHTFLKPCNRVVAGRHCEVLPVPNRVKKKSSISYLNAGRVPPIFVYLEYVLLPTTVRL